MQLKFLTQKLVKEKKIFPVKCEMFKMTQIAGKKKKKSWSEEKRFVLSVYLMKFTKFKWKLNKCTVAVNCKLQNKHDKA